MSKRAWELHAANVRKVLIVNCLQSESICSSIGRAEPEFLTYSSPSKLLSTDCVIASAFNNNIKQFFQVDRLSIDSGLEIESGAGPNKHS